MTEQRYPWEERKMMHDMQGKQAKASLTSLTPYQPHVPWLDRQGTSYIHQVQHRLVLMRLVSMVRWKSGCINENRSRTYHLRILTRTQGLHEPMPHRMQKRALCGVTPQIVTQATNRYSSERKSKCCAVEAGVINGCSEWKHCQCSQNSWLHALDLRK